MKLLPYLDIHTHRRLPSEEGVYVGCLSADELLSEKFFDYTSAGIHPWWLEDYSPEELTQFKTHVTHLASSQKLWAVGETGIDRTLPDLIKEQIELFLWHLELAEKFQLPLVIHNVRSGSDFLEILKDRKPSTPWIFHDFRGSEQMMRDLLRLHPQSYFSFGLSIDNSQQVRELVSLVPLENLFLETDSQKHLDIHDIYLRAAEALKMDISFLKSQIWMNFKRITADFKDL